VLLHGFLGGPIVVAGELGPLEEVTLLDALPELFFAEIEVVPSFDLGGAPLPRGGRDRADQSGETGQYPADERAFARTGRTGDDDESRDDRS
jgi:hypothetical protein